MARAPKSTGLGVQDLRFGVEGSFLGATRNEAGDLASLNRWGLGFRVLGLGFRVQGSGFGVWGLGFGV